MLAKQRAAELMRHWDRAVRSRRAQEIAAAVGDDHGPPRIEAQRDRGLPAMSMDQCVRWTAPVRGVEALNGLRVCEWRAVAMYEENVAAEARGDQRVHLALDEDPVIGIFGMRPHVGDDEHARLGVGVLK